MPRKPAVTELQTNEATVSSPLRRSSRIVSLESSTPKGISTRRNSQVETPTDNVPRTTRSRRSSVQDTEEKPEAKPLTRTRRASMLAEEESKKEAVSTPSRRGRKPSVTESNDEKPKAVRTRRGSATDRPVDPEPKAQTSRNRRKSVDVETQPTPKQTARRKKTSESEEVKPAGGRNSVNEQSEKKTVARKGRKASVDSEISESEKQIENVDERNNPEGISPGFKEVSVIVTPVKKNRIVGKVEGDLDLSIINESSDDINNSNDKNSLEKTENLNDIENQKGREKIATPKSDKKRSSSSPVESNTPRKSPRLSAKLSRENIPYMIKSKILSFSDNDKTATDQKSIKISRNRVAKALSEDDILNSSTESSNSNKENIVIRETSQSKSSKEDYTTKGSSSNITDVSLIEPMEVDASYSEIDSAEQCDVLNKIVMEDTDGSETNFIIEETVNSVDISMKPKTVESDVNNLADKMNISTDNKDKSLNRKELLIKNKQASSLNQERQTSVVSKKPEKGPDDIDKPSKPFKLEDEKQQKSSSSKRIFSSLNNTKSPTDNGDQNTVLCEDGYNTKEPSVQGQTDTDEAEEIVICCPIIQKSSSLIEANKHKNQNDSPTLYISLKRNDVEQNRKSLTSRNTNTPTKLDEKSNVSLTKSDSSKELRQDSTPNKLTNSQLNDKPQIERNSENEQDNVETDNSLSEIIETKSKIKADTPKKEGLFHSYKENLYEDLTSEDDGNDDFKDSVKAAKTTENVSVDKNTNEHLKQTYLDHVKTSDNNKTPKKKTAKSNDSPTPTAEEKNNTLQQNDTDQTLQSEPENAKTSASLLDNSINSQSTKKSPNNSSASCAQSKENISLKSDASPLREPKTGKDPIKDFDSTHYDFNLPSEDDEVFSTDTLSTNEQIEMGHHKQNESFIVNSKNKLNKNDSLTNKISISGDNVSADKEKVNTICINTTQDSLNDDTNQVQGDKDNYNNDRQEVIENNSSLALSPKECEVNVTAQDQNEEIKEPNEKNYCEEGEGEKTCYTSKKISNPKQNIDSKKINCSIIKDAEELADKAIEENEENMEKDTSSFSSIFEDVKDNKNLRNASIKATNIDEDILESSSSFNNDSEDEVNESSELNEERLKEKSVNISESESKCNYSTAIPNSEQNYLKSNSSFSNDITNKSVGEISKKTNKESIIQLSDGDSKEHEYEKSRNISTTREENLNNDKVDMAKETTNEESKKQSCDDEDETYLEDDQNSSGHFGEASSTKKEKFDKSVEQSKDKEKNEKPQSKRLSDLSLNLDEYIDSKIYEEDTGDDDESATYNEFIDDMAEEGEEDTPSEDSNQIIDEGESIGSTDPEEEDAEDEYEDDSFICDNEEELELLSGEEYDLGNEQKQKKKSRIINNEDLPDDEVIKIPKKKKEKTKKKSRIIKISTSSSDEDELEDFRSTLLDYEPETNKTTENTNCDNSVILVETSKSETSKIVIAEDSSLDKEETREENQFTAQTSDPQMNNHNQNRRRKSSLNIHENIVINGTNSDPNISKRIHSLVDSFCSSVSKGEIAVNISLEYEDNTKTSPKSSGTTLSGDNNQVGDIISSDQSHTVSEDSYEIQDEELSVSVNTVTDLREILNNKIKKRLSRSMDDIGDNIKQNKKRKTSKKVLKDDPNKKQKKKRSNKMPRDPNCSTSFCLINQLITDVKNRPRRVVKPSQRNENTISSWTTSKVENLKPSTSPASKKEQIKVKPNFHPKDFKNQMLSDSSRVKRINTNTLLKKKGAFS